MYIGFAPKEDPQIVVATIVENVGSGSKYAAPISNDIINYYLNKIRERNWITVKFLEYQIIHYLFV